MPGRNDYQFSQQHIHNIVQSKQFNECFVLFPFFSLFPVLLLAFSFFLLLVLFLIFFLFWFFFCSFSDTFLKALFEILLVRIVYFKYFLHWTAYNVCVSVSGAMINALILIVNIHHTFLSVDKKKQSGNTTQLKTIWFDEWENRRKSIQRLMRHVTWNN